MTQSATKAPLDQFNVKRPPLNEMSNVKSGLGRKKIHADK